MLIQTRRSTAQSGSTMLEVLISIVVLSFGLLGMLGLILNSLKMTSTSNYRSIAAQQFTAMADALVADSLAQKNVYLAPSPSTITSTCFTPTGACSASDLPATTYGLWQQHLATVLPNGTGSIAKIGGRASITICWDESRVSISGSSTCFSAQL